MWQGVWPCGCQVFPCGPWRLVGWLGHGCISPGRRVLGKGDGENDDTGESDRVSLQQTEQSDLQPQGLVGLLLPPSAVWPPPKHPGPIAWSHGCSSGASCPPTSGLCKGCSPDTRALPPIPASERIPTTPQMRKLRPSGTVAHSVQTWQRRKRPGCWSLLHHLRLLISKMGSPPLPCPPLRPHRQ